jgi:hypothetical protein
VSDTSDVCLYLEDAFETSKDEVTNLLKPHFSQTPSKTLNANGITYTQDSARSMEGEARLNPQYKNSKDPAGATE